MKKATWKFIAAGMIATALLLLTLARRANGFAEWYALHIFRIFPATLGRLFSLLPFSAAEILLLAAPFLLWRLRKRLFLLLACLLLMFTLSFGIIYSRASVAVQVGIEPHPSTVEELRGLFGILAAQAQELTVTPLQQDMRQEARAAMQKLGKQYPALALYYPKPKPLILSRAMSWLQLSGIYSPFTVEANYNRDMPLVNQPFCLCHELAHLAGYAREDEANFIGYLACLNSDDVDFRYSGLFYAVIYVMNALPPTDLAWAYQQLPAGLRRDLQESSAYWQSFDGPAAQISDNINDYYLKANDQEAGVKSYGQVVDLLLAYYRDQQESAPGQGI